MRILKEVVKYVYSRITQWEREVAAEAERLAVVRVREEVETVHKLNESNKTDGEG